MDIFLQQIINGLVLGSIYALVALGYTMVYGVLKLINFAHGDLFTIGAYLGLTLLVSCNFSGMLSPMLAVLAVFVMVALLVAIIPLTRFITGSSIGTWAAVVPLTVAVAPFIARLVETALREVDAGLIEAAQSMGATTSQIVCKVLLPEAMPGIVAALTISLVSLTGYSAMAGAVGGGGLGDLGIRYGYQRFLPDVMLAVVVILIVFVQLIQSFGDWLVRRISHR